MLKPLFIEKGIKEKMSTQMPFSAALLTWINIMEILRKTKNYEYSDPIKEEIEKQFNIQISFEKDKTVINWK